MTLTIELVLCHVEAASEMSRSAQSCRSKVIVRTHTETDTHRTDCFITTTKVVVRMEMLENNAYPYIPNWCLFADREGMKD